MKKLSSLLLALCLLAITSFPAVAQSTGELQLGMSRDWGYGGFNNDIQGLFTLKIKDPPEGLVKVIFGIDGRPIGEDTQPPFAYQFNTDSYPNGKHTLSAIGYSASGQVFNSNIIKVQFVPASTATSFLIKFIGPILGILAALLVASLIPMLRNRGKISSLPAGTQRNYGIGGGAICPKCGRPFPLKLWWINLGLHKIDRCPSCGKWSFVRPRSIHELRAAEEAELKMSHLELPNQEASEADKLDKELNDSKYQDL